MIEMSLLERNPELREVDRIKATKFSCLPLWCPWGILILSSAYNNKTGSGRFKNVPILTPTQ